MMKPPDSIILQATSLNLIILFVKKNNVLLIVLLQYATREEQVRTNEMRKCIVHVFICSFVHIVLHQQREHNIKFLTKTSSV